jgi:glycosyltransferase involved in cell wall biosynthesis
MGVNAGLHAVHICYCHTPQRAWWDLYAKRQSQAGWLERQLFVVCATFVRTWEFCAVQRIDHIVANSRNIANRVSRYFRRTSTVIYPPVDTSMGYLADRHEDYYLSVSRLDKDKGIDLLIRACNQLKRRLVIVGTGRQEQQLKAIAGPTVQFLGRVSHEDLVACYAECRALLFAADEDFGIVSVEAQAFGRPVVAYGYGGSLETIRVNDTNGLSDTGVFFPEQSVQSVIEGIRNFEARESSFVPAEIQQHAQKFDTSVFANRMRQFIDAAMRRRYDLERSNTYGGNAC